MPTTLLTMVQDTASELGLAPPAAVATATDAQTVQLLALMNRCGRILLQSQDWSQLVNLFVINLTGPPTITGDLTDGSAVVTNTDTTGMTETATYYSLTGDGIQQGARVLSIDSPTQFTMNEPADATGTGVSITVSQDTYDQPANWNNVTSRTNWDRTNHWELQGAVTPQQYQWLVSGITATGPRRKYRVQGSTIVIWPPPTASDTPSTLSMEYISSYWVVGADGVPKPRFTADTDYTVFNPDLMVMGCKWLFFQIKGFEYTELRRQWLDQVSIMAAQDQGGLTLDMTGRTWPIFITPANVPDTGYGM